MATDLAWAQIRRPRRGQRRLRSQGECFRKARGSHSGAFPCQPAGRANLHCPSPQWRSPLPAGRRENGLSIYLGILCHTKKALEIAIWYQVGYALVQVLAQNWFSAITYAIWLRSEFRGQHSAWFFRAHLLFFHAWGRILEAGVGFWNPEVDILARGRFWSDFGVPKKIVLQRNDFVRGR